jgi:hypothetical protein
MAWREIVECLEVAIKHKRLIPKKSIGLDYHDIDRGVKKKTYLVTPYRSILATDEDYQTWFAKEVYNGVIMDFLQVQMRMGLLTKYAVKKACKEGLLYEFTGFGRGCTLYINKTI